MILQQNQKREHRAFLSEAEAVDRSYGYDAVGNVSSITKQDNGYDAQSFQYDHLDRLTHWTTNNGQYNTNYQGYSFDLVGNITTKNGGASTTTTTIMGQAGADLML